VLPLTPPCLALCCAGELDIYRANCAVLEQQAGAKLAAPQPVTFNGIQAHMHPVVVLQPSWAPLVGDVKVRSAARGGCRSTRRPMPSHGRI